MPDLFTKGSLEMSTTPVPHEAASVVWSDCLVNRIAVIVVLVLFLMTMPDIIRLFSQLLRCVSRWKGNLDLEHSVSLSRTRNTVALVTALVLCVMADRWILTEPSFKTSLPAGWQLAYTAALITGYVVLRRLFYMASRFRSPVSEYATCLRNSMYNYQILLSLLMLATALPLAAFHVPDAAVRIVLLIEIALFTALHLLRSAQIFSSLYSLFATILYLCALEILPLGILVFACTL